MEAPAEYIFASLLMLGPLAAIAIWSDLREMLIRNWLTGSFAVVATILSAALLEWPEVAYRLAFALFVMVSVYFAFALGRMGGGDAKLLGAVAISLGLWGFLEYLFILALCTLVVLLLHRVVGRFVRPRDPEEKWASFHRMKHFPFGVTIGLSYLGYMISLSLDTL
ncbi:MAG: prepilin peptidase [Pseudomonadota bacterium]